MENNDYKPIIRMQTIFNCIAVYGSPKGIGEQRIGQYVIDQLCPWDFTCDELFYCENTEFWTLAEKHLNLI